MSEPGRPETPPPSILLIDDHTLFRSALTLVLETLEPDWAVQQAGRLQDAMAHCQALGVSDLTIMDLGLPDAQGAEAVVRWLSVWPSSTVVVLSGQDDSSTAQAALAAGAKAFVSKSEPPERLLAIWRSWLPRPHQTGTPSEAERHRPADPTPETDGRDAGPLSTRQLDVLRCISQGMTTPAIARHLGLSEHTVRQHTAEAFKRLGVNNRAQAVLAAKTYL